MRIDQTNGHFYLRGSWRRRHTSRGNGKEEGCAESDSEDESAEEDYSSHEDKAVKKRRWAPAPAPAKAAKAPQLAAATAKRHEGEEVAMVASDDRSSGTRQLSAKAGGIWNGSQHLGRSVSASGRVPSVIMFSVCRTRNVLTTIWAFQSYVGIE